MFQDLVKEIAEVIAANKPADMDAASLKLETSKGTMDAALIEATQAIGEKISFSCRFEVVEKMTMLLSAVTYTWADVLLH